MNAFKSMTVIKHKALLQADVPVIIVFVVINTPNDETTISYNNSDIT